MIYDFTLLLVVVLVFNILVACGYARKFLTFSLTFLVGIIPPLRERSRDYQRPSGGTEPHPGTCSGLRSQAIPLEFASVFFVLFFQLKSSSIWR